MERRLIIFTRYPERGTTKTRLIPTLNEADYLPRTLASLEDIPDVEIIVVDGGSQDGTPEIAETAGCHMLRSPPGRATAQYRRRGCPR